MPVIMLLGGTWPGKKSQFNKRPGPNKAVHGGFFFPKIKGHPWMFIRNLRVVQNQIVEG